jgi:hypothetical protein
MTSRLKDSTTACQLMHHEFWCGMLDSCVDYVERITGTCVEIVDCWEGNEDLFSLFILTSLLLCCCCLCLHVMILVWGGFSCHCIGTRGRGDPSVIINVCSCLGVGILVARSIPYRFHVNTVDRHTGILKTWFWKWCKVVLSSYITHMSPHSEIIEVLIIDSNWQRPWQEQFHRGHHVVQWTREKGAVLRSPHAQEKQAGVHAKKIQRVLILLKSWFSIRQKTLMTIIPFCRFCALAEHQPLHCACVVMNSFWILHRVGCMWFSDAPWTLTSKDWFCSVWK